MRHSYIWHYNKITCKSAFPNMAPRLSCVWSTSMKRLPLTLCYFSAVKSEAASIWMSDTSAWCYFSKTHYCLCSYTSFFIALPVCDDGRAPLRYGSPAGHLTPVHLYYLCGLIQNGCPWSHANRSVVSCSQEGVEGLTAGGLFRQDSCWARGRDTCQLCKAQISPCFSLKKKKKRRRKAVSAQ